MKDKLQCTALLIILAITLTADGGGAIWSPLAMAGLIVAAGTLIYINREGEFKNV